MSREKEKERSLKEHRKAKKSEKGRNTLRKRRPQAFSVEKIPPRQKANVLHFSSPTRLRAQQIRMQSADRNLFA